ncbi:MAG: YgfZ/GcvT domain-containing protein [Luteolibacter sp.]
MSELRMVLPTTPALLEFRGSDAVRFLNGQLTQDVRRVVGGKISLPACVTDAKGKLQFRVTIHEVDGGALWVTGPAGIEEALQARLTRYLIADEVEVVDLTGKFEMLHFIGLVPGSNEVLSRESNRYGVSGTDWWIPCGSKPDMPAHRAMTHEELESLRIEHGVPRWGRELGEGMLPPEALLDATDISYSKGCYIGQEVISRIKSAGKVNRRLTRFRFAADAPVTPGPLVDAEGANVGELTSVSPTATDGSRAALGYLKRGAVDGFFKAADGSLHAARVR